MTGITRASRAAGLPITQLRLADPVVTPAMMVSGEVVVATGAAAVRLNTLTLALLTELPTSSGRLPRVLAKESLAPHVIVAPYQALTLPFNFSVPSYTPLSLGNQRVTLCAVPEQFAADASKGDTLIVRPHPLMERVFTGLEELGFWLSGVDYAPLQRAAQDFPYTQIYTFQPPGRYRRRTGSLRLWFTLTESGLETTLELEPPLARPPGFCPVRRLARLELPEGSQWERVTPRLHRLIARRLDHSLPAPYNPRGGEPAPWPPR